MTRSARELCESMKEAVSVPIRLHRVACLIILAFCVLCPIWSEADASSRQVTVLYFTDAHQLAPVVDKLGERGGVAKLSTVIQKVRRQEPDAIVAFGGDLAGGSLFGAAFRGLPMVEALNTLGVDVATFGQHDFDFGTAQTAALVEASQFPWITSNLVGRTGKPFLDLPSTLVVERQGIRIGFIGLTDAMVSTFQDSNVKQLDLVKAARLALAHLKQEKVDIRIALTQTTLAGNERLLYEVPELDGILSEERSETESTANFVSGRPILSPCGNLGCIIRLQIQLESGKRPVLLAGALTIDASVAPDSMLLDLEGRYTDALEFKLAETLGTLEVPLDAGVAGNAAARFKESNAGNLIADAFRDYHKADIGIINGGGIRANVPEGPFTLKEALSLLPYGNQVCLVVLKGKLLLRVLEHGVARVANRSGAFCQVAGMSYTYDPERPVGERILEATVAGSAIRGNRNYRVALPSFILSGGDGFSMLEEGWTLVGPAIAREDVVVLANYCRSLGRIDSRIEGRITISAESGEKDR